MSPVATGEQPGPPQPQVEQKPPDFQDMFNSILEGKIVPADETLAGARYKLEKMAGLDKEAGPVANEKPAAENPPSETTAATPPVTEDTTTTAPDISPATEVPPSEPPSEQVNKVDASIKSNRQDILDIARNVYIKNKSLFSKGTKPDDILNLIKAGIANSPYGDAALLDIIDQLQNDGIKLPEGTPALKKDLATSASNQEQALLQIAQKHDLLTPNEIVQINKDKINALPPILDKIEQSFKRGQKTNVIGFLKDTLGQDFTLDLSGILNYAGARLPEDQGNFENMTKAVQNLLTSDAERREEFISKAKRRTGIAAIIALMLALSIIETTNKDQEQ